MRKLFTLALSLFFLNIFIPNAFSQFLIFDDFQNKALVYDKTEGGMDFYYVSGDLNPEVSRIARVTTAYLKDVPAIEANGPKGTQLWVFSTGSSNMHRDVHWKHYVDLLYKFDQPIERASISFKYLNTRACGGRVDLILVQYDDNDQAIWWAKKRCEDWENWPGPYTSLPGTINDRKWRTKTISGEEIDGLSQGRPFNAIILREIDITNEAGSGYFDDVIIGGTFFSNEDNQENCSEWLDDQINALGFNGNTSDGAVHATPNTIPPKGRRSGHEVTVTLSGHIMDKIVAIQGQVLKSVYLKVGDQKIILMDENINLINDDGKFEVTTNVVATKGAAYDVSLFAVDSDEYEVLVDDTSISIIKPHSLKWLKKVKKEKNLKRKKNIKKK